MAEATTTYSERAAQMDAYVAEIPFPDEATKDRIHDRLNGLMRDGASAPAPLFRSHPDEADYLMGKRREVLEPWPAFGIKTDRDRAAYYIGVASGHFAQNEMAEAQFYAQLATAYAVLGSYQR